LGCLQFWLAAPLFGSIGAKPNVDSLAQAQQTTIEDSDKRNPFLPIDYVLIVLAAIAGLLYLFNDPLTKIENINLLPFNVGTMSGTNFVVLLGLVLFIILLI